MELFESIYFLIMFTIPAAINIVYNAHVARVNRLSTESTTLMAENVAFCTAVFFINYLLLREQITLFVAYMTLSDPLERAALEFDPVMFGLLYLTVNIVVSVMCASIWTSFGRKLLNDIKNKYNDKVGRDREALSDSMWETVFESKAFVDTDNCVLCIIKNGQLITAGEIRVYPHPKEEKKSFLLYNTDGVKEALEDDRDRALEDKIFPYADYEYYDLEKDLLFKFYNDSKFRAEYEITESED